MTTLPAKTRWIRIGDFFFKHRNKLFPLMLAVMFLCFVPPASYFGSAHLADIKDYVAIAITASGLLMRATVIGFAYIKRGGLNKQVYADTLVTEGFFALCRNPLYVGNMLIYAGVFLMHGHPVVVIGGTLGFFLIYQSIIAAEEYFLRNKFGEQYDAYCQQVPRWGFRLGHFREATHGMRFNFKRVLVKDYSTISNAIIALLAIKLIGHWHNDDATDFHTTLLIYGAAVALVIKAAIAISLAKKRGFLKV